MSLRLLLICLLPYKDRRHPTSLFRLDQAVEEIKAVSIRTKFMSASRGTVIRSQLFDKEVGGRVIDTDDACSRSTTDALDCHYLATIVASFRQSDPCRWRSKLHDSRLTCEASA